MTAGNNGSERTSFMNAAAPHMTSDQLERLAHGELRREEMFALDEHVAVCEDCASRARLRARDGLRALHAHFAADAPAALEHPDRDTELLPYARSRADAVARELVESHLDECPRCRDIVADARMSRRRTSRRRVWLVAAVAATVVILFIAMLLDMRTPTRPSVKAPIATPIAPSRQPPRLPPPTVNDIDPKWAALVLRATQTGRLPFPSDLAVLSAAPDVVRGEGGASTRVSPAGIVIDDVRPTFSWSAVAGATYTVFVFDGDRELLRSAVLRSARWTADRDLPRGRTLAWQVEAAHGEAIETIPSPPAPPARFRIAAKRDHDALALARAEHPHDDLLLAVLAARAGLRAEAEASLRRAAKTNADAEKLLEQNFRP
jgi:hypothetical protein